MVRVLSVQHMESGYYNVNIVHIHFFTQACWPLE